MSASLQAKNNKAPIKKTILSSEKVWHSRISWRITLAIFLTILSVQVAIFSFTFDDYERARQYELKDSGLSTIVPLIEDQDYQDLRSPINEKNAERVVAQTKVKGLAIYSIDMDLLKVYGEPLNLLLLKNGDLSETYQSLDQQRYEVIYRNLDLREPYFVVAKLDSSGVQDIVEKYAERTILLIILMSIFVTLILMIAISKWLLEPILFLRNNLISASKNPENPQLLESPFDINNEIGEAIKIAETLIKQNSDNINRIKSAAEDKIHKLAYYDTLTGLPNRTLFTQALNEYVHSSNPEDKDKRYAIVTIDLDHFKDVNDTMGHNVGDAILRGVGKRLRTAMPEIATVSRTGEDEFAVTMPLGDTMQSSMEVAEKVSRVIREEPFRVFSEEFQIRSSIGLATYPDDGTDPDQVLKNADIALNRAKEEGRDTIKEYSADFDRAIQMRFQMLRDLSEALEQDQLQLHYQPQLDLATGKVIGAEALIRWWKPDNSEKGGNFVSPGEFIPVAESSGLIVPIGEWVLKRACIEAKEWKDQHGHDIRIAVNVSAAQFSQSDLVSYTQKTLEETGLDPRKLELEVTESVFMDDIAHTIEILKQFNQMGIELAIDDFGTGYSSLSYLRQFPIDRLKIDQSFIRNALDNADDAAIAKTIIGLGHSLNLNVIAEGVETLEHEKFLQEHKCDEVQGFRYSKPVPQKDFIEFVNTYNSDLSTFNKTG